jgi:hypothetical protein
MVQQLRKLMQRYKIFSLFVGGIDEFSGKLGREMKVRFDKFVLHQPLAPPLRGAARLPVAQHWLLRSSSRRLSRQPAI